MCFILGLWVIFKQNFTYTGFKGFKVWFLFSPSTRSLLLIILCRQTWYGANLRIWWPLCLVSNPSLDTMLSFHERQGQSSAYQIESQSWIKHWIEAFEGILDHEWQVLERDFLTSVPWEGYVVLTDFPRHWLTFLNQFQSLNSLEINTIVLQSNTAS